MSELIVIGFDSPVRARAAYDEARTLQADFIIGGLRGVAVVTVNAEGKTHVETPQKIVGMGAASGALWGMLIGLLFFVPFFGLAIGAVMGGLMGKFSDYGIDDNFIKQVQGKVTEGTSALFLLTSGAVVDRVIEEMKKLPKFEIIQTNLSKEQEDQLRAEFGEE